MENNEKIFQTGYAQASFTPPLGMNIPGYFKQRISEGIINDLLMHCIAFDNGTDKALYFACDAQGVLDGGGNAIRKLLSETYEIPFENIFIHASHSHTTAYIQDIAKSGDIAIAYSSRLHRTFVDTAKAALDDLHPTKMKIARGEARDVGFNRLYEMKDGSYVTNPRWGHPDILRPVGQQDHSVQLIRLVREEAKEIVIVNFGTHPDTLGGKKYYRDWPGFVVEFMNRCFDGEIHTVMINGCQGNSNHWNKMRGHEYDVTPIGKAQRMARIIAGEALKIYDNAEEVPVGEIRGFKEFAKVGQNPCTPEEIEYAKEMRVLYNEHKDSNHPVLVEYRQKTGMSVPKSNRILANLDAPEFYEIPVFGLQIGSLAFIGFAGEPFCEIGIRVKAASKMPMTVTSCCTNGSWGYFPTKEAFAVEGGYERNSSKYAHNLEDVLVETAGKIIEQMK